MIARLRALGERDRRLIDAGIAVAFGVVLEVNVLLSSYLEGPVVANILVFGVMAGALYWRRTRPLQAVLAVMAALLVSAVFLTQVPAIPTAVMLLVFTGFSIGMHGSDRSGPPGLALGVLVIGAVGLMLTPDDLFFPVMFFWVVPWVLGRVLRSQTQLTRELTEKADRAERERELEGARAVAEERRRVARELHDVLAHDLSVIVVQASAARRIIDAQPERATDAARLIERTGREALAELRHLFGAVRRGEGEPLEGSPSVERIDRLADRAQAAGLPVDLRIEGEPRQLPPGIDLAGYRVVQEALTNALRHAGPARAEVVIRYEPDALAIEVSDDGAGPGSGGDQAAISGSGNGLIGMRERVELYGGSLEATKRREGGFAVRARMPVNGGAG